MYGGMSQTVGSAAGCALIQAAFENFYSMCHRELSCLRKRAPGCYFLQHADHVLRGNSAGDEEIGPRRIGANFHVRTISGAAQAAHGMDAAIIYQVAQFMGNGRGQFTVSEAVCQRLRHIDMSIGPRACAKCIVLQHSQRNHAALAMVNQDLTNALRARLTFPKSHAAALLDP